MTPDSAQVGNPLYGVLLVILATLVFAVADTLTKHLAMLYPVPIIMAVRYLVNVAVLALVLWPGLRSRLWQAQRIWLVIARGLCLTVSSLLMVLSLRLMPLGETVAIIYVSPFLVMLLAAPLLGERVGLSGWVGAGVGFLGVLLIVRPGSSLDPLGVTFALLNAALSTVYTLLTRLLSRTETTAAMLFHAAWVGALASCLLAAPQVQQFEPAGIDVLLLLALGGLMTLAHFLFTAAYRKASASMLAPFSYVHLVWASGLGWLVFGHVPEALTLAGMALVLAAGVAVALNSRAEQRAAKLRAEADPEPL